jgi:hypothetical protein
MAGVAAGIRLSPPYHINCNLQPATGLLGIAACRTVCMATFASSPEGRVGAGVLRTLSLRDRQEATGEWRSLGKVEIHNLRSSSDGEWMRCVVRIENKKLVQNTGVVTCVEVSAAGCEGKGSE